MRFEARELGKAFGGTAALNDVSLRVAPGRIHAVLGENGAGKSTLMRIVAGAEHADSGSMLLDGAPFAPNNPRAARNCGVAIVYQELSLCPHLSVMDNLLLGVEPNRFGFISARRARERLDAALAFAPKLRQRLAFDRPVFELSTAERQLVEIARALAVRQPRLLILDEPTSSLGRSDVDLLFEALLELSQKGLSVLYISHFLEELRRIAHDYTVLRDGLSVDTGRVADKTNDELIAAMAGHRVEHATHASRPQGELLIEGVELCGPALPVSASFQLHRGEILGIAGLVGSGRSELLRTLFGLERLRAGQLRVAHVSGSRTPAQRLAQGVGLLSEDRKGEGLALSLSVAQNLTLSKLAHVKRRGLLSPELEQQVASELVQRLGIRCSNVGQKVTELSGGNQQKVALGRLLYHGVDVLLLDEPTRGIDVRSRGEIHRLIVQLAAQGKAILIVSSQLEELFEVCDRIAVMHRGRLGPALPREQRSEHEVLLAATGGA